MNRENFDYVQQSIGYEFTNPKLLIQAFTRKSYSAENPESLNNEVLEFYGDEILDFYVTRQMYSETAKLTERGFESERTEDELTKMKSFVVNKDTLSLCISNFGFEKFLIAGKSDIQNKAKESKSVREDLFEAIIGAVAVDSNWDYEKLDKVCCEMLKMITRNGYLYVLLDTKARKLGYGGLVLCPPRHPIYKSGDFSFRTDFHPFAMRYECGGFSHSTKNLETGLNDYEIRIAPLSFRGHGNTVYQAFLNTCSIAYKFLCKEEIKRTIKTIDFENPVSTLRELAQKEIIVEPGYHFSEYHDTDGNPIWRCSVYLEGFESPFTAESKSKKEVKQLAASYALKSLVETEELPNE